jgi:o-succinylbenzoate synthase
VKIVSATVRELAWSLDGRGAARGRVERRGLLLEVTSSSGVVGRGEASPLPGMSRDTIEDAHRELAAFTERLPLELGGPSAAFALAASITSPSARFAVETALLDPLAREHAGSIAALIDDVRATDSHQDASRTSDLVLSVVVDDATEAADAVRAGATCLKVKVGDLAIDADVERVRAIAAASSPVRLRLDANQRWSRGDAVANLTRFAGLPIDFVEEPCVDAHELLATPLPVPIALDESLAALALDQIFTALASPSLGALVLKPTLLGGFSACLALAALARAAGKPAIVTHALESEVGLAACTELARVIGGAHAHGLAPYLGDPNPISTSMASMSNRPRPAVRVASPGLETVAAVWSLLGNRRAPASRPTRRPLALIHHALPAVEFERRSAIVEAAHFEPDDAVVLFTSGSTAEARGVVLSHAALRAAADASAAHLGWRDDDTWFVPLSLAHAGGFAAVVRCWYAQKPIVLLEGDWDPARAQALLAQCTLASLVPTQLADLLADPAWRPPANLRAVLLGGAAASPALLQQAAARGVPFLITYGMTESFGQLATAPLDRAGDPDAVLEPLRGVELVGGTREAPAPIRVRAPMLATRYLDGEPIAPTLVTRDLGFVEDGVLTIVGRVDDVIITGGENVHPAQVEAVLAATPGVRAACAFAVPDDKWGQIVGAAIATDQLDDAILAAWHAALPAHARPRELAIVRELPLLATGKLDRRAAARLPREPVRYR